MPVEINASLGLKARSIIEAVWPEFNEDNYAEYSNHFLDRANLFEDTHQEVSENRDVLGDASEGEVSEAILADLATRLDQLSEKQGTSTCLAENAAMESQNIFNTKNMLNALGLDFETKWNALTQANMATGGSQPQIQMMIQVLVTLAEAAAQMISGGFNATHEGINSNIQNQVGMSAPPSMMPPNMTGGGSFDGWGASPMMPAQFANNPAFWSNGGNSPMMYGSPSGEPGSLIGSLANAAPGMLQAAQGQADFNMKLAGPGIDMLEKAAGTIMQGVAGAAEALGDALGDGPVLENGGDAPLPSPEEHLGDYDAHDGDEGGDEPVTSAPEVETTSADDGPAGGGGGGTPTPRGGGDSGDATHMVQPVAEAEPEEEEPDTETTSSGSGHGFNFSANASLDISTDLTSGEAATAAPTGQAAPTGGTAGAATAPAGGVTPLAPTGMGTATSAGRATPAASATALPISGDKAADQVARHRAEPAAPTAAQRGAGVVATVADCYPEGTPIAVAVFNDYAVVTTPDVLGMPMDGTALPTGVKPLALVDTLPDDFYSTWIGGNAVDKCLAVAAADGHIPRPDALVAYRTITPHLPGVDYADDGDLDKDTATGFTPVSLPQASKEQKDMLTEALAARWNTPSAEEISVADIAAGCRERRWDENTNENVFTASMWWATATIRDTNDDKLACQLTWLAAQVPQP